MFVCGEIRMALDDKGRLRVPMKFRLALGEGDCKANYVIYAGTNGSLIVETERSFKKRICDPMLDVPISDHVKQDAFRKLCSTLQTPEEDNQGRFVLQSKLKILAGIKKKVVFLGVGDRIEIWSEEVYDGNFAPENIDMNAVFEALEE